MRAYKKPNRLPCTLAGCTQPLYARGLCTTHYSRLRKNGDVGPAGRLRGEYGAGSVNGDGYRTLHDCAHPLATAQGKLLEHRAVLYAVIGDGPHPCHWCGKKLTWRDERARLRINADHLDGIRTNNDPSNLVPSCLDCNTKRSAA